MKKKIILFILLFIPFIVKADEKTIFSLNDVTSAPGSNVTIKFNIKNNPEFGVLTARVKFDNTKLEYISGNLTALKSASIKGIDKNKNKGLVAIYAISISNKLKDTGDVATMEFKINDSIKDNIDIPLSIEIVDYGVDADKSLEYEIKNGVIHVNGNTETKNSNTKESLTEKYKEKIKEKNKDEDVTWESSNDDVAKVDDGVVEFKEDGNATIEAKDKDGNVVYSKDYYVKGKIKKSNNNIIKYILIAVTILLLGIFIWRKKWKKRRKKQY